MKTVIESVTIFLLINTVASSPMYYTYDETPDKGYGATIGNTGPYKNHKKYFIGGNNQKYMKLMNERAVDSHFTVQKSPSKPYVNNGDGKVIVIAEVLRDNYRRKANENVKPNNSEHHDSASTNYFFEKTLQDKDKTTMPDQEYNSKHDLRINNQVEYLRNVHDKKHNFVSVNAHKAALATGDKVMVMMGNQQHIQQPQGYQIKITGAAAKDYGVHKSSVTNKRNMRMALTKNADLDRHTQMLPQNAYSISQKSDFNSPRIDNKKRDAAKNQPSTPDHAIRSISVSDKIKKYIHKDVNNYKEHKNTFEYGVPSRINNHEEIVDNNETPYALFYRTNSEHVDGQEVLIENPLAEPKNGAFSDKMTWNIESEVQEDSIKSKSKRAPNVKIQKKVKNHTSYKNR